MRKILGWGSPLPQNLRGVYPERLRRALSDVHQVQTEVALVFSDGSSRFLVVYSVQQIKHEILAYIYELGGDFFNYYVGIAKDPEQALFETHKVDKTKDPWLYRQALSNTAARTIQDYFSNRLRVDGTLVINGNEDTDWVYVYEKSERTNP